VSHGPPEALLGLQEGCGGTPEHHLSALPVGCSADGGVEVGGGRSKSAAPEVRVACPSVGQLVVGSSGSATAIRRCPLLAPPTRRPPKAPTSNVLCRRGQASRPPKVTECHLSPWGARGPSGGSRLPAPARRACGEQQSRDRSLIWSEASPGHPDPEHPATALGRTGAPTEVVSGRQPARRRASGPAHPEVAEGDGAT